MKRQENMDTPNINRYQKRKTAKEMRILIIDVSNGALVVTMFKFCGSYFNK